MRGKVPTIQQRMQDEKDDGEDLVGKLNNLRDQLDKKEEEHGDVWGGLVEV